MTVIIEGVPAGLPIDVTVIDADLKRRQHGYGRGGRMQLEHDTVTIQSGVRLGQSTGAPIVLTVLNRDYDNWRLAMSPAPRDARDSAREAELARRRITRVRPGHADWAGAVKYGHEDVRDVLERASARETVTRVAVGAIARQLLKQLGIGVSSHVVAIGSIDAAALPSDWSWSQLVEAVAASSVSCWDPESSEAMVTAIDAARDAGTSLGGVVEVVSTPLPVGLGSYTQWDRRLDGRLAQAVMSIPAVKGVEFGLGFAVARRSGAEAHDSMTPGFRHASNRAGGIEGGVSNGAPLVLRAVMKPISTQPRALPSVDLHSGESVTAHFERADTCAVPACAVVAESMVLWTLAVACLEKYGGDSLGELLAHHQASERLVQARWQGVEECLSGS